MKILIETIPHGEQRYPTLGDWTFLEPPYVKQGEVGISIKVSELGDWRYEALVALHEMVEVLLCKQRGITCDQVDQFDKQFEKDREAGLHGEEAEPGDDPAAPYKKEHFFATNIEALTSAELMVDWATYEGKINELP